MFVLVTYAAKLLFMTATMYHTAGAEVSVSSTNSVEVECAGSEGYECKTIERPSLFCFTVALPGTREPRLLAAQLARNTGIFGCDEWAVYSNQSLFASFSAQAKIVSHSFAVQTGGRYYSLMNAGVFLRVWRHIFREGRFRHYDWTVKVDPDTVFLSDRLTRSLQSLHQREDSRSYLLNGLAKLWGPIEVLSRGAMETFAAEVNGCEAEINPLDKGEDYFLHLCMDHLGLDALVLPSLLSMSRWRKSPCNSSHIAFHPFKREVNLIGCLQRTLHIGALR
eukprot:TRINITY_DN26894_c0_g1_i1.p1 TRINITY_DN26894_c0_g1~~TRINITY_DN26894_c0_g1_i1.p1  ORF type:complete len:279 (-),score=41.11 TRINITY_DN26894_c0_g1_i1:112-948(-)